MRCIVLGAGIAGLVAALDLARGGCDVLVVEAAPFPGGRTSSWRTRSGLHADTGLHVFAEHYRTLFGVLESVGATDHLRWWDSHYYRKPPSADVLFRLSRLPTPLHLLYPARTMRMPLRTGVHLLRAAAEVAFATQESLSRLDDLSYLTWHRQHRLGDGLLLELADYAADSTTFLEPDRVSARALLSWLKYMFRSATSARVGTWSRPISEALVHPLVRAIETAGGTVRTSTAAVRIDYSGGAVRGIAVRQSGAAGPCYREDGRVETGGPEDVLTADAVISALPVQALRRILDPELTRILGLGDAVTLPTVPALSVVLGFDRRIACVGGALLVGGRAVRNVIDLGSLHGESGGSCLQALVGRAASCIARSDDEIVDLVRHDLHALYPEVRHAKLADVHVARIEAAMFAARPGTHARRPGCRTTIDNFLLAGDWTRHELNASMEGAAYSGRRAARALLHTRHPERAGAIR